MIEAEGLQKVYGELVAVQDLTFRVEPGEPESPVDVRRLAPDGHVLLVPLDDFPVEDADSLAWWFRERFGTAI